MLRIAKTESGLVKGMPGTDVRNTIFKGIPFAANTSGENRWRPPQPVEPWEGIRKCYEFAPITMQKIPGKDPDAFYSKEWHCEPEIAMSEDGSLALNVYTPAKSADEKLPVMVWIFGGGMQEGYCHEMEFDGEGFNRRGVILVTIAYRVNAFGFLCHPELTAENPDAPTNFGLLDQKAGIEWVKRNIANFGGDPDNITIFGQSAGGRSTWYQCCSPQTKGLFKRAIAESGSGMPITVPAVRTPKAYELKDAEQIGVRFLHDYLGVDTIEEARKLPAQFIMDKYNEGKFFMQAVVDGKFITDQFYNHILNNTMNDVQMMFGNTKDEFMTGPAAGVDPEAWIRENFGEDADKYLELSKAEGGDPSFCTYDIVKKVTANVMASNGKNAYYYVFGPSIPGDDAGAFHSCDLWFEFETLAKCWRPFDGHHYDVARKMCTMWANFAKTGDPNGCDKDGTPLPEWRKYSAEDPCVMYFKDEVFSDNTPYTGKTGYLVEKNTRPYQK